MAFGAVFGEMSSEEWPDEERKEMARLDWEALSNHPDLAVHLPRSGRSSIHRRGVLVVAEDDLGDPRLEANREDLGIPPYETGPDDPPSDPNQRGVERTGLGFAICPINRSIDPVEAANYLRGLEGRHPLRIAPDNVLSPSQGSVVGPGSPPRTTTPKPAFLQERLELAAVERSVRVGVIDSGLVSAPLADPLLAPGTLAGVSALTVNPAPDPLWDGTALRHWAGGHGTHVAGVLAHASGGAASIVHLEALDDLFNVAGFAVPLVSDTEVARAVAQAVMERCRVINLSLGGPTAGDYVSLATALVIERTLGTDEHREGAGCVCDDVVLVASAGNGASSDPWYPAALNGVIGVAALNRRGTDRAKFSNFGPWVTCCAVGENVIGPYVTGAGGPRPDGRIRRFKGWARWDGTSFAAPYVSGLIAKEIAAGTTSARVAAATVLSRGVPMPAGSGLGVKIS